MSNKKLKTGIIDVLYGSTYRNILDIIQIQMCIRKDTNSCCYQVLKILYCHKWTKRTASNRERSAMMAEKYNIRFSGAGTHGLIQAARIIAEAAAIYDDKIAIESCSYGPEARGNASRAEVIISDETIDYPKAKIIDFLVTLTQEAYDKYNNDLKTGGILVADTNIKLEDSKKDWKIFLVPFNKIAANECNNLPLINMIALGFFAKVCDIINESSIRQAILARIPKESEKTYIDAFETGLRASALQAFV